MQNIIVALSALILLIALLNPFDLWMPGTLRYVTAFLLVVVVGIFAGLVLHESPRDEREEILRDQSGRAGYLAGIAFLTIGIVVAVLEGGRPDMWLITVLGVMVAARVFVQYFKS